MAIQKEIWVNDIQEGFFPDNSFAAKSVNDDAYVEAGKKVHVPNAGGPSNVVKNRSGRGTVAKRTDVDVDYNLDEFTTDPVLIPNADTVELSYDKRNSVISQDKQQLMNVAHESLLVNWAPAASKCVRTTGSAVAPHLAGQEGNRLAVTKSDIRALMTRFDAENIPQTGRYLLLDAEMYGQLLASMTETDQIGFLAAADVKRGVVGSLYGFEVMKRSTVLRYAVNENGAITGLAATDGATDVAAALAWHEGSVRRALGEVKMFGDVDNPEYYGDIYSFLVRCGGKIGRYDKKGVWALCQGVPAAVEAPAETTAETTENPGENGNPE